MNKLYIIILIIFLLIILISSYLIYHIYYRSDNKIIKFIEKKHDANKIYIYQPKNSNLEYQYIPGYLMIRNKNEFSYSFRIYLKSKGWKNTWKHIFHRGTYNNKIEDDKIQYPGFWIEPTKNNLISIYGKSKFIINDIDLDKWTDILFVFKNNTIYIYRNLLLENMKVMNEDYISRDNVYICYYGGFNGYIQNLYYYNYALI
jgi:hypothetical protein